MVIKRIGPVSVARIAGTLYAVLGLVLGAIFSVVALAGGFGDGSSSPIQSLFGVGAVVFLPICYGLLGFVGSFIAAWIYNVLATSLGGVEIEVQ